MPLNMTKIAFGCDRMTVLAERLQSRAVDGQVAITTRYLPKRHAEMIGGSLYWIIAHRLVARSEILSFGEAEGGRTEIHLSANLIPVQSQPKRAHQGWRYLEEADAPADLGDNYDTAAEMPAAMTGELTKLALI